ncbi:MAG: 3-oxoacyl-[acyl-carrier-protein] synthase III C-terminal domain-containing protein, partial [Planctomycetota bacterium]|nr:3-oxoacyl-[acyl-carrier-protein] synthase III C-terminal domain-containing protein [Planctomycetota bacterium]
CVEVSTVHFHHDTRLDRLISNILFADGAAATVVGVPNEDRTGPEILATASRLIEASADAMAWEVGDRGFDMTLAAEVPDLIGDVLADWVDESLAAHGVRRADIGGWAIHPGGPRVIDAVCTALELPPQAATISREVLRHRGNMSSATLLHILERFQSTEVPRPWVGLAFGPGLSGEMVLIR